MGRRSSGRHVEACARRFDSSGSKKLTAVVIVVAPCGYGLERCLEELPLLQAKPGWADISAVRNGRVCFADGNAYFNRPGPRLADSAEMLVEMIHPSAAKPVHKGTAWVAPLAR